MTAYVRRRGPSHRLAWLVVVALAFTALLMPSSSALGAQEGEIDICHATGSHGNPYVVNSPSKNGDVSGHADHTGPIWFEGIDEDWGDIIPPFTFTGGSFDGLNWTTEGQAIWNNGCKIPDPTPTPPTPTPPTPTPPTPTPPTPTPPTPTPPTPTPTGEVGGATGTPAGSVGGATATPAPTLPRTDEIDAGSTGSGDGLLIALLAMAGLAAAALLLTPARAVVRKDDAPR